MNETIRLLAQHDYWLLRGAILARQACLPIPAYVILVAAGPLVRSEKLSPSGIAGLCLLALLGADLAWYGAGRKFAGKILHFACGITRHSATGAHEATSAFDKQGVRILIVFKFIPGFNAVAAPLARQAHVSVTRFLVC